jgi:hypothetical protein
LQRLIFRIARPLPLRPLRGDGGPPGDQHLIAVIS